MTRNLLFSFLLVLFWGTCPANGQQEGSVEIAKAVTTTPVLVDGPVNCLETAAKVLPAKDAAKFCLDAAKIEADRAKRIANEAADATKASRPQVFVGGRYSRYSSGAVVVGGGYYTSVRPRYYRNTPRTIRPPRLHNHRERP